VKGVNAMNIEFRFFSFILLIGLFLPMIECMKKQDTERQRNYPLEIKQYEFLRYSGGQEVISPDKAVNADNNWKVLLACMEGKTRDELVKTGIKVTESQLLLLKAMRFIHYKKNGENDTLFTVLPVLGREQKQSLIQEVREFAEKIEPELEKGISNLKEVLMRKGYEEYLFSILFSFIVDGIVWFSFRDMGFVSEFTLSPERPLFDGVYWAYCPKREFRCGTNIAMGDDLFLILNWSDGPQEKIQKIFSWENLRAMHGQWVQSGRIIDEQLRRQLIPYRVIDQSGRPVFPVIEMSMHDPVFPIGRSFASGIVQFMVRNLDLDKLRKKYRFADRETAFVVFYHEWMWEFMEYMTEKKIIEKPEAFKQPEKAGPEDIGKLLFIVKGSIIHPKNPASGRTNYP